MQNSAKTFPFVPNVIICNQRHSVLHNPYFVGCVSKKGHCVIFTGNILPAFVILFQRVEASLTPRTHLSVVLSPVERSSKYFFTDNCFRNSLIQKFTFLTPDTEFDKVLKYTYSQILFVVVCGSLW